MMETIGPRGHQPAAAVLTVAASSHAGKTSLIMALVDQLRDQLNMAVVLGPDATDAEVDKFEATGIPARSVAAGGLVKAGLSGLGLDEGRLDLVIREVPWEDPCVLRAISVEEVLKMLDGGAVAAASPGGPAADAVAINKADTIGRTGIDRAMLAEDAANLWPESRLFFTSATTGAGLETLAQWVLERYGLVS